jgi:hypothetical protein
MSRRGPSAVIYGPEVIAAARESRRKDRLHEKLIPTLVAARGSAERSCAELAVLRLQLRRLRQQLSAVHEELTATTGKGSRVRDRT